MSASAVERLAIIVAISLVFVQTLRLWWARAAPRFRLAAQRRRAAAGEHEAEVLLRSAGYRIEARQPRARLAYGLDGSDVFVDVRADLLVRRGRRRYVAEVKTGAKATELANRATRRQLLEYAHAFDVDAILLVDADGGRVSTVRIPDRATQRAPGVGAGTLLLGAAVLVGALLALATAS
jgi:hypothetical protein